MTEKKFDHGKLVMTQGVAAMFEEDGFMEFVHKSVARHLAGDWGSIPETDAASNEDALENGLRLMSAYGNETANIWIITEADRSVTTVLLPSEY